MKKQVWFLDIDGVFSIPTKENASQREKFGYGLFCWPIPVAFHLIRAIADDRRIHPVWLSCWDTSSLLWNAKAGTRLFPVGYHLSGRQKDYADRLFSEYAGHRIDRKLVAARYYLRKYPTHEIVWIEDGFMTETEEWARQEGRVKLVDTTQDDIREMLLREDNLEDRARKFIEMCKIKQEVKVDY